MIDIALLGYGTVGKGAYEILENQKDKISKVLNDQINVKKILVRNLDNHKGLDPDIVTDDFSEIINDDEIKLVVEMTGDREKSYEYIKESLKAKKHLVTSNKAVVSDHLSEFNLIANTNNVKFLFEAAVGGSIPIVTSIISQSITNNISRIRAILNGTSNYIISNMYKEHKSYEAALKEAQELGFAERDPYDDVEGIDALRKLKILSSIAFGMDIPNEDVINVGMSSINLLDINHLKTNNLKVKVIAESFIKNGKYALLVEPVIINDQDPFYPIDGVNNIVEIFGDNYSSLSYVGEGAGKLPTGNAIVVDIIDALNNNISSFNLSNKLVNSADTFKSQYYLRTKSLKLNTEYFETVVNAGGYAVARTKKIEINKLLELLEGVDKKDYFIARYGNGVIKWKF